MSRTINFKCDGCDDVKVTPLGIKGPSDWKNVRVSWTGMDGFPAALKDDSEDCDLCPSCAKQLASYVRPRLWPRSPQPSPKQEEQT